MFNTLLEMSMKLKVNITSRVPNYTYSSLGNITMCVISVLPKHISIEKDLKQLKSKLEIQNNKYKRNSTTNSRQKL